MAKRKRPTRKSVKRRKVTRKRARAKTKKKVVRKRSGVKKKYRRPAKRKRKYATSYHRYTAEVAARNRRADIKEYGSIKNARAARRAAARKFREGWSQSPPRWSSTPPRPATPPPPPPPRPDPGYEARRAAREAEINRLKREQQEAHERTMREAQARGQAAYEARAQAAREAAYRRAAAPPPPRASGGVQDRVEKLLRLTQSDNPHEADLACRRAKELIAQHRLAQRKCANEK